MSWMVLGSKPKPTQVYSYNFKISIVDEKGVDHSYKFDSCYKRTRAGLDELISGLISRHLGRTATSWERDITVGSLPQRDDAFVNVRVKLNVPKPLPAPKSLSEAISRDKYLNEALDGKLLSHVLELEQRAKTAEHWTQHWFGLAQEAQTKLEQKDSKSPPGASSSSSSSSSSSASSASPSAAAAAVAASSAAAQKEVQQKQETEQLKQIIDQQKQQLEQQQQKMERDRQEIERLKKLVADAPQSVVAVQEEKWLEKIIAASAESKRYSAPAARVAAAAAAHGLWASEPLPASPAQQQRPDAVFSLPANTVTPIVTPKYKGPV